MRAPSSGRSPLRVVRRWLTGAALLAAPAVAAAPAALAAQGAPPPAAAAVPAAPPAPTGRLVGQVFDSLVGRPLGGALVQVMGTDRTTVTDAAGRWALDGVPAGRAVVTFAHPALDSIGLYAPGDSTVVPAGGVATLALASPSYATLARRFCPRGLAAYPDSGIVFGTVATAAGALLEGAEVAAVWTPLVVPGAGSAAARTRRGRSDGTGTYAVCGVVTEFAVTVQGFSDRGRTGALDLIVPERKLLRQDLVIGETSFATAVDSSARGGAVPVPVDAPVGTAILAGTVRDSAGRPAANVTVQLVDGAATARTDAEGRYTLGALPGGTQSVEFVGVGFRPERHVVDLRDGRRTELDVTLVRAVVLATVETRARATAAFFDEVAQRKALLSNFTRTAEQLEAYPSMGSVFREVPQMIVEQRRGVASLYMRGTSIGVAGPSLCTPFIFVDGQLTNPDPENGSAALWDFAPQDIAAIEVFRSMAQVPPKLQVNSTTCGVVAVWTRWYARMPEKKAARK